MAEAITLVLPCYNPIHNWPITFKTTIDQLQEQVCISEIILVDDGSTRDLSVDIAYLKEQLSIPLRAISYVPNRGKGYAVRQGIRAARTENVIYTDIDFPYKNESFLKIYAALMQGESPIIVGQKNVEYYRNVPLFRRIISKALRTFIALFLRMKTKDTQCGLKGINKSCFHFWTSGKIDRYLFELEAIYTAEKSGVAVKSIPIAVKDNIQFTSLPLRLLWIELKNLVRILFG